MEKKYVKNWKKQENIGNKLEKCKLIGKNWSRIGKNLEKMS